MANSRPKTPKKKKVVSVPIEQIDPNMVTQKLNELKSNQELDRKKMRVDRLKATRVNDEYQRQSNSMNRDGKSKDSLHHSRMQMVNIVRETTKENLLDKA
jgi:hypothetical protein